MKITVLGCSGSVPGPGLPTSGYLVEADGLRLVVELGGGTFRNLQRHCSPFDLDALLLSHLHLDHCADFAALTTFRRHHPRPPYDPRERRLPVHAPAGAPERLAHAHAASREDPESLEDVFDFLPLRPGAFRLGPCTVEVAPMRHICEAYGFRIECGGRSLVFSGDTAVCPELVELARGADVLLADTAWVDRGSRPDNLHMSGREAAGVAVEAGVGRLLLTHVLPWSDRDAVLADAASVFPDRSSLVELDGVYDV
ncbi:MBL fold metallo-hydrolase [Umezawaea tangerina]|uniref:Ribonuclease BN (tRNA processing enzyme) n=1 Tax=Umezawaea tangerina TaxID=84725 RepID=A0A2T0SPA4_9PSEU|nr:MBL fold metallo-hydrolase [Umezawaea tangerina]PRY35240.1 ribonuclease BN (tRNA processing enzyme) [Umezawaea tangerina]